MNTTRTRSPARRLVGALAACLLAVVVLGEISLASVPTAHHAVLLQA